jgi:hypothetical protein
MEGISGDITTEQVVMHRSSLVDRRMTSEENYKGMILTEWEGYLLVILGKKIYIADSRTAFSLENHREYEWFYWEMDRAISSACVHGGVLYLGCADGIYTLTGDTASVTSYWVTPKDRFGEANRQKTTNKRGCVVEATGDIAVYAKTEDTTFTLIGAYESVEDCVIPKVKQKKFKDIQLKFFSESRFSLESVTIEAFIGGYVKKSTSASSDSDIGGGGDVGDISGGYEKGYHDGRTEAERLDALEDAALLAEINKAFLDAAMNPNYGAESLSDVPKCIGKIYDRGYEVGEIAAMKHADEERIEVNAVLSAYGEAGADTLDGISGAVDSGIRSVSEKSYDHGFSAGEEVGATREFDRRWESVQAGGTRVDYNCAFRYWQDEEFHPKYKVVPVGQNAAYSMFQWMQNLKKAEAAYIDLSNVTGDYARTLFNRCDAMIEVEDIKFSSAMNHLYTFYGCPSLEKIAKITCGAATKWTSAFNGCTSLRDVTFEGVIGQNGLSFSDSPYLSESSIRSVMEALSTSATGKTVTFSRESILNAFGSTDSGQWLKLCYERQNWTITLV